MEEAKLKFIGGDRHCPTVPAKDLTQEDIDVLGRRKNPISVEDLLNSGCYVKVEEGPEEPKTEAVEVVENPVEETKTPDDEAEKIVETEAVTEEETEEGKLPFEPDPAENELACPHCDFVARTKSGLQTHISAKHKDSN